MREEEPQTKNADEQDRHREPCTIEEPIQGATVCSDHAFDEVVGVTFHPGAFVSGFALAQDARTHQGRERQRHKTRGKNSHDDRDRELAKDAAEKSRDENQRNENSSQRKGHRQMVKEISPALLNVALRIDSPCSARRTTFSKNTMASSTRKPMANVSAINVRLLMEKLSMYITATVSSNDIGNATAGISVSVARPRNT